VGAPGAGFPHQRYQAAAQSPFKGIRGSFYGDLHATGKDGVRFFTENKVEIVRYYLDPGPGLRRTAETRP
jgi:hypothetical protein